LKRVERTCRARGKRKNGTPFLLDHLPNHRNFKGLLAPKRLKLWTPISAIYPAPYQRLLSRFFEHVVANANIEECKRSSAKVPSRRPQDHE
jgi:hypothetical protein